MHKKVIILYSCMLVTLFACQKDTADSPEVTDNNDVTENITNEETALAVPDETLEKGDNSGDVEALQQVLLELKYPTEATGTYGDITTWAITDIQLQKDIPISGRYDEATKEAIANLLAGEDSVTVGKALDQPSNPDEYPEIVENPYDILALVNKGHALPGDYEPEDLVIPDVRFPYEEDVPKKHLRKVAAEALEDLIAAGDKAGVTIFGQSGFRSYGRQEAIFASNADKNGAEHANTYSARAGESEHQTGLVMDVTAEAVGFALNTDFGETEEGIWVAEHAHDYGFIIRYPADKTAITKYQYEPWHLRYVGKKAATEIHEKEETLEEYLGVE